jgi:hypothetical protein
MLPESTVALLLIDGLIAFVLVEAVVLGVRHRVTGHGPAPREFVWNLLAGVALMAALHCALSGTGLVAMALCLAGAGLCHAADLRAVRFRSDLPRRNDEP